MASSASSRADPDHVAVPADGEAGHLQRRLPDADRDALPVLAAGADAGVQARVVADHLDRLSSASGPLPINVAPFTGAVTRPSSIR